MVVMNKQDIIDFFDSKADSWDLTNQKDPKKINLLLDYAGIKAGISVLDVACGTGVLFPFYKERNVGLLTAVDISSQMVRVAREKFPTNNIICADVETIEFSQEFDAIMVFNAFPHFLDPDNLIKVLASHLKAGGRLTVCHDMARKELDHVHEGTASKVSMGLMPETDLAKIFQKYLSCDTIISDDEKYIVSGVVQKTN